MSTPDPPDAYDAMGYDAPIHIPIDGIIDLHCFRPNEIKDLISEYLHACREKGIYRIRIIHGKGTGNLRRTVHSILDQIPWVDNYHFAEDCSSWGATIVRIEK